MAIDTAVLGSYPVPDWLPGRPTAAHLRDAVLVVVSTQELAGIEVVTDGEVSRFDADHPETNGMIDYFVRRMDGIRTRLGLADRAIFDRDEGLAYRAAPAGVVVGPIGPGVLNLPEAARPLSEVARRRTKVTLTSPYMLAKVLVDRHYGDVEKLCMAIAEVLREQVAAVDADVVQLDEANLTGHPADTRWATAAINHVLDGVRGESAVHLCFGNYGGQVIQSGTYESLLALMNALRVDHVSLELARRGESDLRALRDLDERIGIGLGVIDVKTTVVEAPAEVARRIDLAERTLGEGRVRYVNPDCGLWMLHRSVADAKMRAMVEGRDLYATAGS